MVSVCDMLEGGYCGYLDVIAGFAELLYAGDCGGLRVCCGFRRWGAMVCGWLLFVLLVAVHDEWVYRECWDGVTGGSGGAVWSFVRVVWLVLVVG